MSVSTGISRITGFIRNIAMAYALGQTLLTSSYVVANNIPNMIYELVAGGVLSSVFIPIFIERMRNQGDEDANALASSVLNLATIALGIVALIATVFAEPFVRTQTFTLKPAQAALAVYLFRFFAIQIVFYGAAAIFTGVLNSHRHFIAPAAGPIFNNVVVIMTMLIYPHIHQPRTALVVLGVGTTLGVVAQMLTCLPPLINMRWKWRPSIDWHHPALRRLGVKLIPVVVYVTTNLAGISFRNAVSFAAHTPRPGQGPAALQYAWMFYQLPYGVLAVALATAIFPELSDHVTHKDWQAFKKQFTRGLRANASLIIPSAAMLIALSYPLCRLYVGGKFTIADVPLVSSVLVVWALGLFSFAAYMFTMKAFFALQDTRTPMLTNIVATAIQVSLYWVLTMGVMGWAGIGLPGLPAGDTIAYTFHLLLLLFILRRRLGSFDLKTTVWTIARVAVAGAIGGLLAYGVLVLTPGLASGRAGFLVQIVLGATAGLGGAYALARLFGVEEMRMAAQLARRLGSRLLPGRS